MITKIRLTLLALSIFTSMFYISCKKEKDQHLAKAVNLYFTLMHSNSINKIDLVNNPNAFTVLYNIADGINTPEGIALTDDGYLIVTCEFGNRILKMKKDSPWGVIILYDQADGINEPTAVTIDNTTGNIYWCNSGNKLIMKGSEDGLAIPSILYEGTREIIYTYGMAIDINDNKLYISDFKKFIKAGNLDGSGTMEVLFDNIKFPQMIAPSNICIDPDNGKMYWTDETANMVVEANIDGTGTPVILFDSSDGVNRPDGISVDYNGKKIYWSETRAKVIARGNLDGTGSREILVNNVEAYGLALELK